MGVIVVMCCTLLCIVFVTGVLCMYCCVVLDGCDCCDVMYIDVLCIHCCDNDCYEMCVVLDH